MVRQKVKIINPSGLHIRPAGIFCEEAMKYSAKVSFIHNDNTTANAKSVLSVLGAKVKAGDEITIICEGDDEQEALQALVKLVEKGFGK